MKNLSRRAFIKGSTLCGCGVAAYGAFPGLEFSNAFAATGNGSKVVFINMAGGWDGLSIIQPSSGATFSALQTLRPTLARDPSTLLSAGSNFGLHPLLTNLKSLYDEGSLLTVMNVGYEHMSRSHLDSEVALSRGIPDRLSATASGFITRMGSEYGWSALQAVSVSGSDRAFEGGIYRGTQVNSLDNFRYDGDNSQSVHEGTYRRDMIYSLSADAALDSEKPLQETVQDSIGLAANSTEMIRDAVNGTTFTQTYPNNYIGRGLRDVDRLLSNPSLGTEIAYARFGGFDTHSTQENVFSGLLPQFNSAFGAFVTNMKAKGLWNNLIVVIYSEFGRTNRENGSNGTDHGGAFPTMITGGLAVGGIVGSITPSDLTGNSWLSMRYNVVGIYRQIVQRIGYDPDRIFGQPTGLPLPGLFK